MPIVLYDVSLWTSATTVTYRRIDSGTAPKKGGTKMLKQISYYLDPHGNIFINIFRLELKIAELTKDYEITKVACIL